MNTKEKDIADALLLIHKNVKSVYRKMGAMSGTYRVRKLKFIGGMDNPIANYKEHSVSMKLDVSKVYFSVRLSNERGRIASLVKDNENILALFAGVGPFPLVISKKKPNANIVAIELNPIAVKFMRENIKLNRVKNIKIIEGDVHTVLSQNNYSNWADRIIMPMPKSAETFLDVAIKSARVNCMIHIYGFIESEDTKSAISKAKRNLSNILSSMGKIENEDYSFVFARIVRPYAPKISQVVVDLKVLKL